MSEERIFIQSGGIRLEGRFHSGNPSRGGAVIAHPHPQMGGSMDNNVVEAICGAFQTFGFATLRFNFRGVGLSEGRYDGGRGEQDDIRAAVDDLTDRAISPIILAGYSFGAWVIARLYAREPLPHEVVFVSPPIDILDTEFQPLSGVLKRVVCGGRDSFCDPSTLQRRLDEIGCPLDIAADADHFFFGRETVIGATIKKYLENTVKIP